MSGLTSAGRNSLAWQLAKLGLGIVVPALIFVAVLLWQFAASERTKVETQAQDLARRLAAAIDREIYGIEATMRALATSPALPAGDLNSFYGQAVELQRQTGMHVSLRDPEGHTILSTRAPLGTPVRTTPELLEVDGAVLRTKVPAVSNIFVGAVVKRPVFQAVVPVMRDGSVIYLLGASFEPSALEGPLARERLGPDWLGAVVDRNNTFVLRSHDGEKYVGKQASATFKAHATAPAGLYYGTNSDGVKVLAAYDRSLQTGWATAASTPMSSVAALLGQTLLILSGLGGLLALIAGVLALRSARHIAGAMRSLRAAAVAIEAGDVPELPHSRIAEVDEVGRALESTAFRLQERSAQRDRAETALRDVNDQLEARVAERTKELENSNRTLVAEMERREAAETQIQQMQKMEAVGQLTGGIAHDFNNMLAIVIGGLNVVSRRLKRGDHDVEKFVDAAVEGATRAATLTQRLLAFSRQQPLAPQPINANGLLAGMSELLQQTLGIGIKLETVLADNLWLTHADVSQLENALLNLTVNARDAMLDQDGGSNGKLTIETSNEDFNNTQAQDEDIASGQYVAITVTDTGAGMSPEVIAKAFDPFFTTKETGKGTGLGLSQVYGFVKQSGGQIRIHSKVGHGTTVRIFLPRFEGEAQHRLEELARKPISMPSGNPSQIILVVDDEDDLRAISVDGLRELGYTVRHAESGVAALRVLDGQPDVALLFTDIVMPDMNGRRLADEAMKRRPALKVLFTSGFARDEMVHDGALKPGTNFLPKPYTLDQLAGKVRDVLDA